MNSTVLGFIMMSFAIGTAIVAFFLALALKFERDASKKEVISRVDLAEVNATNRISEVADSIIAQMFIDAEATGLQFRKIQNKLGVFYNDISEAQDQLQDQIKALNSPLKPFRLNYNLTIDYSKADEGLKQSIVDFNDYLKSLGSYEDILEAAFKKELPRLILHYVDEDDSKPLTQICNTKLIYDGAISGFETNSAYNRRESAFLRSFFPRMYMALSIEDKMVDKPEWQFDLVYGINYFESKVPVEMEYRILLNEEKIYYQFSITNPAKVYPESGRVKSLQNCKKGLLAFGFLHPPGITIEKISIQIDLNDDFNQKIGIPLLKNNDKGLLITTKNKGYEEILWSKGSEFIQ